MSVQMRQGLLLFLVTLTLWLGSCTGTPPADEAVDSSPSAPTEEEVTVAPEPTDPTAGLPVLEGLATVELVVNGDTIVLEIDGDDAPVTAGNFVDLVERGVYDGTVFHRVIREPEPFVVQGGDPLSKDPSVPARRFGTGNFVDPETETPRYIPLEIKPAEAERPLYGKTFEAAGISASPALPHTRGAVAMARSDMPNSASAQFYIALGDLAFLDGNYAVFGYVTEGMDVVDGIQQGDTLESATVTDGLDNLQVNP
ncbi:putative GUN4 domain containing protein [Halomicronema hongdechloris C2206]|uniref:Peptidyl-prolyl cis-trans isomerase n=1 Tax=Halomicronema hongdechloris C2206 TaxID=1641165 RepID=A0A1Z3HTH1_9CYAN|nr:peptidylprolyl isomerase [Halomicronema hongdechloris]ASC73618.1 putative GUN4 domain containing protein [Halomicronema hongdechloris C2206]